MASANHPDDSTQSTSSPINNSVVSYVTHLANMTLQDVTLRHQPNNGTREDAMTQTWLLVLFISLYCVVFILGISGNSLVVYAVLHSRSMQTITNVFITNLAASDILMCLLAVPFTPISGLLQTWVFGEALCHVVPMVLGVSVHVSTLTSTAIAVDRFFVIVYPFRPRITMGHCLFLIAAIWLLSLSISLPLALYQKISWLESESIFICHEQWPRLSSRQFFTVTSLILQYIVPCSIITFCYIRVSQSLRMRARVKIGTQSRKREHQEISRKRKTNRMLIAMVSIFVCCWLPLNVIHLILEFKEDLQTGQYFLLTFFVAHIIAMSSIVYNPFLYAWLNENFKKEFKHALPCLFSGPIDGGTAVGPRSSRFNSTMRASTRKTTTGTAGTAAEGSHVGGGISNIGAVYEADMNGISLNMGDGTILPADYGE